MSAIPSFRAFYRAVHGRDPFPWQARLARRVADAGWPDEIGVPTGLGRTACIDIAVWALAADAVKAPIERRQPRRIWYVVNRRLLVDAADDEGNVLAGLLNDPSGARDDAARQVVRDVSAALRSLCAVDGATLHVSRLRGGAALGVRPPDPATPSLILATVPMFASRWLFRGYGSSDRMSPIDAALAGTDSVVLLDEAHLALPLARLGEPLAACDPGRHGVPLPATRRRPQLVRLTATGAPDGDRFDLDDQDRRNPVIAKRLAASKATTLVTTDRRHLAAVMADEASTLLEHQDRTCLVFANTPKQARDVYDRLAKGRADGEILLLTGQVRAPDAKGLRDQILDPANGFAAGSVRSGGILRCVVATQTLEVGADLDADHLVTESAGRRALTQRLGRLNRFGQKPHATAIVCHPADAGPDPLYGDEPAELARRLGELQPAQLSPARVSEVLGPAADEEVGAAEPLPSLVWEWVKTSRPPLDEAPVERYFSGPDDDVARVSICWRAFIPTAGQRLRPAVRAAETVDVGIGALRVLLKEEGADNEPWRGARLATDRLRIEEADLAQLRPGDVLVMPSSWGHYDRHGWAPSAREEVSDLSFSVSRHLALEPSVLRYLFAENEARDLADRAVVKLRRSLTDSTATSSRERRAEDPDEALAVLLEALANAALQPSALHSETWGDLAVRLAPRPGWLLEGSVLYIPLTVPSTSAPLVPGDDTDDLSFLSRRVLLNDHLVSVGKMAERIGQAIGLSPSLVMAVREAGGLHDLGKHDDRFQRLLGGGDGPPVAKSSRRRSDPDRERQEAGWPRGGRHEVLSARLVEAWLAGSPDRFSELDRDLVVHLVLSHHGHGRPWVAPVAEASVGVVTAVINGEKVSVASSLGMPNWQQPARFRMLCERYGYWGLTLLEAVVRQADHRASAWIDAETTAGVADTDMGVA